MGTILITFTIVPRISEIGGGHIGNAVPPAWFEEARLAFLEQAIQQTQAAEPLMWMVRHAVYDYAHELLYRGAVEIRSNVTKIGITSLTLHQEAWQNGHCAVTAVTTLVLFNGATKSKATVSSETRSYLEGLKK
jgi:acyl-CoA thioester hydrolase